MLPCPHNSLEILLVVINCITVVYRPPRSPNSLFDSLCRFVASMNIHWFSHFLLIGDYSNVSTYKLVVGSFIETCDLPQIVGYFTLRAPNDGTSLTDPVLTSSPYHILECNSFPPLANYDHNGLNISISMKSTSQSFVFVHRACTVHFLWLNSPQ